MNVWRWLGISIFLLGTVCLLGTTNYSGLEAFGAGKKDEAKKVEISADSKAAVKAGEKKSVVLKLKRGKAANKEVTLTVEVDLKDKGVTVIVDPKVAGDKDEAKLTIDTTDKADGEYKITVKSKSEDSEDSMATVALTVAKAEAKKVETPKGAVTFKAFEPKSKKFYQLQKTKTKQEMKVMGQVVIQTQEQSFLIEWIPQDANATNDFVVAQKIVGVKMEINIGGNKISYDSTSGSKQKNPMTDFFEQLQKQDLKFTIKSDLSEVKSIDGRDQFIKGLSDINPQMQSLLKAILSDKALTKMAEPTWYAFPEKGVFPDVGKTWSRKSDLDLGPIGRYDTNFDFTYNGLKDGKDEIGIKTKLTYTAPTEKAGLPFIIHKADLKSDGGTGTAIFDRAKGRFDKTEIKMNLTGNLEIEVGSMKTTVELTQTQEASSTTLDELPADWKAKQ
jgi:hypothetical protein